MHRMHASCALHAGIACIACITYKWGVPPGSGSWERLRRIPWSAVTRSEEPDHLENQVSAAACELADRRGRDIGASVVGGCATRWVFRDIGRCTKVHCPVWSEPIVTYR